MPLRTYEFTEFHGRIEESDIVAARRLKPGSMTLPALAGWCHIGRLKGNSRRAAARMFASGAKLFATIRATV
jgi:hypothetical protein